MKHSPATPLPWAASEFLEMGGYDCMTGSITVAHAELDGRHYGQRSCEPITTQQLAEMTQDAAYIVHAANAYGPLVEALKEMIDGHPPYNAKALLRSLGEAE